MQISSNSQLGLRFRDNTVKVEFLRLAESFLKSELEFVKGMQKHLEETGQEHLTKAEVEKLEDLPGDLKEKLDLLPGLKTEEVSNRVERVTGLIGEHSIVDETADNKYFFICESVYKAAELIKIADNFTSRALKDIKPGQHTYLMGKHKMLRFLVRNSAIRGFYYDEKEKITFDFGCLLESGDFYLSTQKYNEEFTGVMKLLTFVELGDITVKIIEGGKSNGLKKKEGKIHNSSNKSVYVVDSTWNQIIIRTTGFAVRGHFRLQPCGEGHRDRMLVWISAFEKHGYKRRPKAEILD